MQKIELQVTARSLRPVPDPLTGPLGPKASPSQNQTDEKSVASVD